MLILQPEHFEPNPSYTILSNYEQFNPSVNKYYFHYPWNAIILHVDYYPIPVGLCT